MNCEFLGIGMSLTVFRDAWTRDRLPKLVGLHQTKMHALTDEIKALFNAFISPVNACIFLMKAHQFRYF